MVEPGVYGRWADALLRTEWDDSNDSAALVDAAVRVSEKLAKRLESIFTRDGSDAVWSRALYLSKAKFRFLAGVEGTAALPGLSEAARGVDRDEAVEGIVTFIATTIELLLTFLGPNLVRRSITDVWPDASLDGGARPEEECAQ